MIAYKTVRATPRRVTPNRRMSTVGPSRRMRRAQTNRKRKNRLCDGKFLIVMYVFMWCMFNPCLYVLYGNSVGKRSRTVGGKMVSVLLSKGEKNRYEEQWNNVFTTENTLCESYLCLCLYDGKYVVWTIYVFCVYTATWRGTQNKNAYKTVRATPRTVGWVLSVLPREWEELRRIEIGKIVFATENT